MAYELVVILAFAFIVLCLCGLFSHTGFDVDDHSYHDSDPETQIPHEQHAEQVEVDITKQEDDGDTTTSSSNTSSFGSWSHDDDIYPLL